MSSPQYPYAPQTPPPSYVVPPPSSGPNVKVALGAGAIVACEAPKSAMTCVTSFLQISHAFRSPTGAQKVQ